MAKKKIDGLQANKKIDKLKAKELVVKIDKLSELRLKQNSELQARREKIKEIENTERERLLDKDDYLPLDEFKFAAMVIKENQGIKKYKEFLWTQRKRYRNAAYYYTRHLLREDEEIILGWCMEVTQFIITEQDTIKSVDTPSESVSDAQENLTYAERCWINKFKYDAGYEEQWDRRYCLRNNIRINDLYGIRKRQIRRDEFENITPHLKEFPKAFALAEKKFYDGQDKLHGENKNALKIVAKSQQKS